MKVRILLVVLFFIESVKCNTPCQSSDDCRVAVHEGSSCRSGFCTNPYRDGCLKNLLPNWNKQLRACNSDDPENAVEQGICQKSSLDYLELRLHSMNWESVFFETWILQIILSEILDVPTTVETGSSDAVMNFYDPIGTDFQYGLAEDLIALKAGYINKDCRAVGGGANYTPCSHFVAEDWNTRERRVQDLVYRNVLETPQTVGVMGQEGWFIPLFSAKRDPTMVSYVGLQGEQNRRKLAEFFLTPTTWKQYCDFVSETNCTVDDGVAKRAPREEGEFDRMFFDGLYVGHFRKTDKNDCDQFPNNCTGEIADYPCGWSSFTPAQLYYLNISLAGSGQEPFSHGYTYQQLKDIWYAANATKSNVIMQYWTPEPMVAEFVGTDAEFIKVSLPPPTQECVENRISEDDRCDPDWRVRVGDPRGICDEYSKPVDKLLVGNLGELDVDRPEAAKSPGPAVLERFSISELQLDEIFQKWQRKTTPREAVCEWAVENIEYLESFIPFSYPRYIEQVAQTTPLFYVALVLSSITTVLVGFSCVLVFRQRNRRIMKFAQIEFLFLLLLGSLLVSLGALVIAVPSTNAGCIAEIWLIGLGYTLELVPLIVKVHAINRLVIASRQMRRLRLKQSSLFVSVFAISCFQITFLSIWTAVDPPGLGAEYTLTEQPTTKDMSAYLVQVHKYCYSQHDYWEFMNVGWALLLLLIATVLAFQMRKNNNDLNESRTLAFLIYSHFIFMLLVFVGIFLSGSVDGWVLALAKSILFSIDTIGAVLIYFVPKFLASDTPTTRRASFVDAIHHFQQASNLAASNLEESASGFMRRSGMDDTLGEAISEASKYFSGNDRYSCNSRAEDSSQKGRAGSPSTSSNKHSNSTVEGSTPDESLLLESESFRSKVILQKDTIKEAPQSVIRGVFELNDPRTIDSPMRGRSNSDSQITSSPSSINDHSTETDTEVERLRATVLSQENVIETLMDEVSLLKTEKEKLLNCSRSESMETSE